MEFKYFLSLKGNNRQPRIICPEKTASNNKGDIKTYPGFFTRRKYNRVFFKQKENDLTWKVINIGRNEEQYKG